MASQAQAAEVPLFLEGPAAQMPWQRYATWPKGDWRRFNSLANAKVSPLPKSEIEIKDIKGDAAKGRQLAFSRERGGGCLACHVMGPDTPELPGNVGPDLSLVGARELSDQYLYNYVFDARVYNPLTVMPPWGAFGVFSEAEIRDIVAFLKTLKKPAQFKNPIDDPSKRPLPVEDRDPLDPFINPAAESIETGKARFAKAGPRGKSCLDCHAEPEKSFALWAAHMPKWEPRLARVLGVEEFVYRHARAATGAIYLMQSEENTDLSIYLRYLARGKPIWIEADSRAAKLALAKGQELANLKIGQLNFACIDCHDPERGANKWIRGQWLGEQRGQYPHLPVYRTSRNEIWDIRKRLQWCNVAILANELAPDAPEYGYLEFYLAKLNEGLKLNAPNIRH